jgi:hypothetical protein
MSDIGRQSLGDSESLVPSFTVSSNTLPPASPFSTFPSPWPSGMHLTFFSDYSSSSSPYTSPPHGAHSLPLIVSLPPNRSDIPLDHH